jgi:hypothetical protein
MRKRTYRSKPLIFPHSLFIRHCTKCTERQEFTLACCARSALRGPAANRLFSQNAHTVRSHTCHNAHDVHIFTLSKARRVVLTWSCCDPFSRKTVWLEPVVRGVHDHEDTFSRMGGIGAVLAAHSVRSGLRRSLCSAGVATGFSNQDAKGAVGGNPAAPFDCDLFISALAPSGNLPVLTLQ